jgi:phosphoglycerate dehydrogenase-like enzyme
LKQNEKAHYSADVISDEQNKQESSLYKYFLDGGNVTLTPHIGGMTTGSRQLAYELGITKFLNYIEKENEK